jgi:hypothetical protein
VTAVCVVCVQEGTRAIAHSLGYMPALEELILSDNSIYFEGQQKTAVNPSTYRLRPLGVSTMRPIISCSAQGSELTFLLLMCHILAFDVSHSCFGRV